MKHIYTLVLALLCACVIAQAPQALTVELIVTKDPSGEGIPRYRAGDALRMGITVNQDAYVYLFEFDDGVLIPVYPNPYDEQTHKFFAADTLHSIPPQGADYEFILNELQAERQLIALAVPAPLAPAILSSLRTLSDLEGGVWALDEVRFQVGDTQRATSAEAPNLANRPAQIPNTQQPNGNTSSPNPVTSAPNPAPSEASSITSGAQLLSPSPSGLPTAMPTPQGPQGPQGSVQINSQPEGAEVFVGDRLVGITPLITNVDAGLKNITLRLQGYKPVSFALEVSAEQESIVETYLVADSDANTTQTPAPPTEVAAPSQPANNPAATNTPAPAQAAPANEPGRVSLTVITNVSSGEVFLDSVSVGQVNNLGELQLRNLYPGERIISVRAAGFEALEQRVYLSEGMQRLNLTLQPVQANSQPSTATPFTTSPAPTNPAPTNPSVASPTAPNVSDVNASSQLAAFASPSFGLRNYPEARLLNIIESTNRADSFIESIVPSVNLFAFFEKQLMEYGWQQTNVSESENIVLGDYRQGSYNLRLEVTPVGTHLHRLSVYRY